jgi:glutathione S-transferase
MSSQNPDLELYELQSCPYCAKVRRALDELDLEYESHAVPRKRTQREEVQDVSGQYGVPVLVDETNGVRGMPESDDIVAYLYEEYGDGQEPPPSGLVGRLLSRVF